MFQSPLRRVLRRQLLSEVVVVRGFVGTQSTRDGHILLHYTLKAIHEKQNRTETSKETQK
jgi:hypothetical protein